MSRAPAGENQAARRGGDIYRAPFARSVRTGGYALVVRIPPRAIKRRLEQAREEIEHVTEYDFVVVNDDLERAGDEVPPLPLVPAAVGKTKIARTRDIWNHSEGSNVCRFSIKPLKASLRIVVVAGEARPAVDVRRHRRWSPIHARTSPPALPWKSSTPRSWNTGRPGFPRRRRKGDKRRKE